MRHTLILTGDINLLGVADPTIPFARMRERLHAADAVFANLECCFYEPENERSLEDEGFYAPRWEMRIMLTLVHRRSARRADGWMRSAFCILVRV